jgi:CDP-glucose 4,6-dehydratase
MYKFYKNKRVLITGHTGFKGAWLALWLNKIGAKVSGIALDPCSEKGVFNLSGIDKKIIDIRADIRDLSLLTDAITDQKPEIIFHLAAQPLVGDSYRNPITTYETNIIGTANVLEAMRNCPSAKAGIFITTDKCYKNKEQVWGYRENDRLGGHDPYSASKAAAELVIESYRSSFFNDDNKLIASARAGNVIGGGDWAPERIITDCIESIEKKQPITIRKPEAIRPWQHVLEPLSGYLKLGINLLKGNKEFEGPWNFGPSHSSMLSVEKLVKAIIKEYGDGKYSIAQKGSFHETSFLSLDISKARNQLAWFPVFDFQTAVKMTVDWYKCYSHENVFDLCNKQINIYECLAAENHSNALF